MPRFRVTYDIVTPESAEVGDYAETGFVMPGGWKYDIETANADTECDYSMSLREALRLFGGAVEDSGRWFREIDSRIDYRTGEDETRSLHPPRNITPASYKRLRRLLDAH